MIFALQTYLREVAGRGRDIERIGPFLATFTRSSENPFLNYAIPDENAAPSPEEISALSAAYQRRDRLPRLEFLPEVAPQLENALLASGFTVEARMPLMICELTTLRHLPVPADFECVRPVSDAELFAMLAAQNEAYSDDSSPTEVAVERQRALLEAGGLAVLARVRDTGEPAGGGICNAPLRGITELSSIGVRPRYRRRGLAGAMTAWLTREAFARDLKCVFLMAAGEAEVRIYARVGFARLSEVVGMSFTTPVESNS